MNESKKKGPNNDNINLNFNQLIDDSADAKSPLIINIMERVHDNNNEEIFDQSPNNLDSPSSDLSPIITTDTDNTTTTTSNNDSSASSPTIDSSSSSPTTPSDDNNKPSSTSKKSLTIPINNSNSSTSNSTITNSTTISNNQTITVISSNNTTLQSSSPSSQTYEAIERMASQRNQRKADRRAQKNKGNQQRVEPIQSELLENDWLLSGYAEKQGRRSTMEDALVCELTFRQHDYAQLDNKYESFIGIYDGHGGSNTSKYVSEHLHLLFKEKLNIYEQFLDIKKLLQDLENLNDDNLDNNLNNLLNNINLENYYGLLNEKERQDIYKMRYCELIELAIEKSNLLICKLKEHLKFKEREQKTTEESIDEICLHSLSKREVIPLLIRETFLEVNENVCKGNERDGSTASIIYLPYIDEKIAYIGNVGDSRIVLCRSGEPIRLTIDHRPSEIDERRRVKDAGGTIYGNRVNACLAITRAIGDKSLHPYIISDASTMVVDLMFDRDEFIVVACDGLWDYVSEEQVVTTVRYENDPVQASIILRELAYDKGSTDNISVIVIRFKPTSLQEYI